MPRPSCPKCARKRYMERRKKAGKKWYWVKRCLHCKTEYDMEPVDGD